MGCVMAKLEFEGEVRVRRLDRLVLAERLSGVEGESGRYMRAVIMLSYLTGFRGAACLPEGFSTGRLGRGQLWQLCRAF